MKAIVVHKPGDSSEMKYEEIPIPEPGESEVSAIVPSRMTMGGLNIKVWRDL